MSQQLKCHGGSSNIVEGTNTADLIKDSVYFAQFSHQHGVTASQRETWLEQPLVHWLVQLVRVQK